jgi:hypothetical protein
VLRCPTAWPNGIANLAFDCATAWHDRNRADRSADEPEDAWERLGSVGKPQLLCHARIVDAADARLRRGRSGSWSLPGRCDTGLLA